MKKLIIIIGLMILFSCSNDDDAPAAIETNTEISLNTNSALTIANEFCSQKQLPQTAVSEVFSSYGARNLDSCAGDLQTTVANGQLSFVYSDFCYELTGAQSTLDGTVAASISLNTLQLDVHNLRVITDSQDLTINGSLILSSESESAISLNLSVLNNETGKLFKLMDFTFGSQSFFDISDILDQLNSFDGNLSFISGLNYSGRIFYTGLGEFEFAYENEKTILISEEGARLEFLADSTVRFQPVNGDAVVLNTSCSN